MDPHGPSVLPPASPQLVPPSLAHWFPRIPKLFMVLLDSDVSCLRISNIRVSDVRFPNYRISCLKLRVFEFQFQKFDVSKFGFPHFQIPKTMFAFSSFQMFEHLCSSCRVVRYSNFPTFVFGFKNSEFPNTEF